MDYFTYDDEQTPEEEDEKFSLILDDDNLSILSVSSYDSIDNFKFKTMGQYTCDECSSIPMIINLDDKTKTICFRCEKHGLKTMNLNNYICNCLNYNPKNWLCSGCDRIQRNCKEAFIYCQCNKVFCQGCFWYHKKIEKSGYEYTIESYKFNMRCKKSKDHYEEFYKGYCHECKNHYCERCEMEHKWHEKVDIKTMFTEGKEIEKIKELNKEYERLISFYRGLIKLNELIIYSYNNYRYNYYNLNNINTIIKIAKRNEIINTLNDKDGAIIPGEKNANITDYMKNLYQLNIDSEIDKITINNKFFNNYDLRVLIQMPLNNLRLLDLENNSISQIDCLKNSDFANLAILNLNNNEIKDISNLQNVSFKDKLQALFLRNNRIKDISIFGKKNFASLKQLDLRNNYIDDIKVFDSLKKNLTNLQRLYLANNPFDKIKFETIVSQIKDLPERDIEEI